MPELTDMQLLNDYAERNSQEAFAALVQRHINLVYSVAMRHVGDPHQAQDVTQAVFVILARKAATLRRETILTGWLYQTARFASADLRRSEARRQRREQEAYMQSTIDTSKAEASWENLAPVLDDALAKLDGKDRETLLLRYFEGRSVADVARLLQLNEPAVKKRATRAIEKLRKFFVRRGIAVSATVLAGAIGANSVQTAPAALAKSVTVVAVAKGAAASTSTLTLIKGTLKIMAWTKAKSVVVVAAVFILTGGTTLVVARHAEQQRQAKEPIPQDSWSFVKYATPEAAFQSSLWAMSKGDMKAYLRSLTPEFQGQYMASVGSGKSEADLDAMIVKIAGMIGDFQMVSKEVVSVDEYILHFRSSRMGNASVPMKKIQGEWKINGNLATDAPNNIRH